MTISTIFRVGFFSFLIGALMFPAFANPKVLEEENSVVRVVADLGGGKYSTGTGFVVDEDGYILTNMHVVKGGRTVAVYIREHEGFFEAEVEDTAPGRDLALLKIDAPSLSAVSVSDAERQRGAPVFAIGYPGAADRAGSDVLNAESTLTDGIISSEKVAPWSSEEIVRVQMIQHNAAVTEGNSGGPLFDNCGRVIGVNTQRSSRAGVYWSSAIEESMSLLKRNEVDVNLVSTTCGIRMASSPLDSILGASPRSLLGMTISVVAVLLLGLLAFMMLRRQTHPAPAYGGNAANGQSASASPKPNAAVPANPKVSFKPDHCLVGLSRSGHPIRLEFSSIQMMTPYGVVIGRDPEICDVCLNDPEVSRRHIRIFQVDGRLFAEDLNSSNGSKLDGQVLSPFDAVSTRDGANVEISGLQLTLRRM